MASADSTVLALQIAQAIKERNEAEEAHVRLKVMRGDEALFRKALQEKRREKYKVKENWDDLLRRVQGTIVLSRFPLQMENTWMSLLRSLHAIPN